jgi:hypothetical protein
VITEYELYPDERYEDHRKLLLGGLVVRETGRRRIASRLAELTSQYSLSHEMRWGKVFLQYLEPYKAWVGSFFSDPFARFSCLVIDISGASWKQFQVSGEHRPSRDAKLASVFYQFLLVTFGALRDTKRWCIYPDAGFFSKAETLDRVEFLFNRTYKKAFGAKTSRIIRLARARDSKKEDLIQVSDIILAAFSYSRSNRRPTYLALADYVREQN